METTAMELENRLISVPEDVEVKEIKKKPKINIALWFSDYWRAILSEFLATTLLLLLGCMTCIPITGLITNPPIYSTLGFGLVVLINIQIFGHISGAHMNPIVTLAAVIWGKISIALGIAYFIAQCAGAIIGYGLLIGLSPVDLSNGVCATQPHLNHTVIQALGVEIVLTAVLIFLNCSVWDPVNANKNESGSTTFGLAVAGLLIAGVPLTGAGMNPARSLAPAVWTNTWNAHWVYWVGPFLGGIAAVLLYKYVWLRIDKIEEPEILQVDRQSKLVS